MSTSSETYKPPASDTPLSQGFTRKTWLVTIAILMTELCERLTYYSLSGNLILYCQSELHITSVAALNISFIFTGCVYFIPLLGGYLADTILGRFNTIFGSGLLYLVGMVSVLISAGNYQESFGAAHGLTIAGREVFFFIGLVFIAVGTGGIKSNVSPFGAQQLEHLGPRVVSSFFNWFYWFINLGSAIAFLFVVYIQQEVSFFYGYLIPTLSILLAIIIFFSPKKIYEHEEIRGNALKSFFQVNISAISNYKKNRHLQLRHVLDYARLTNGGDMSDELVDNTRQVLRVIPVFGTLIMFWTVYFQMQSTFFIQGEHLNLNLTSKTTEKNVVVPVASLNLFNTFGILLITPLIDKAIFPLLRRYLNYIPTQLQRIGLGMLFAATAIIVAGILEIARKKDIEAGNGWMQTIGDKQFLASKISVFVQIPQFLLIGIGEIFTSVTSLEFAFAEAPKDMRSVIMGVCLVTSGLGSFFGSALVSIVKAASNGRWMPEDFNEGNIENFCFLLGGLMFLDFFLFIVVAYFFNKSRIPKTNNPQSLTASYNRETDQFAISSSKEQLVD